TLEQGEHLGGGLRLVPHERGHELAAECEDQDDDDDPGQPPERALHEFLQRTTPIWKTMVGKGRLPAPTNATKVLVRRNRQIVLAEGARRPCGGQGAAAPVI